MTKNTDRFLDFAPAIAAVRGAEFPSPQAAHERAGRRRSPFPDLASALSSLDSTVSTLTVGQATRTAHMVDLFKPLHPLFRVSDALDALERQATLDQRKLTDPTSADALIFWWDHGTRQLLVREAAQLVQEAFAHEGPHMLRYLLAASINPAVDNEPVAGALRTALGLEASHG